MIPIDEAQQQLPDLIDAVSQSHRNYSGLKHHNDLGQSTEVEVEFGEIDAD